MTKKRELVLENRKFGGRKISQAVTIKVRLRNEPTESKQKRVIYDRFGKPIMTSNHPTS